MDDNNRRRRQKEPPYPAGEPRFNAEASQDRVFPSPSSERYRPASLMTSPATIRGAGATTYSGYYPDSAPPFSTVPANPLQYQPAYPQEQRQQQGFATYNTDLMYNVPPQAPQSTVYDSAQQFQARQPAGMQMLSDVAVPYFPNEPASAPGLQHHASSSSPAVYQPHQQGPTERPPPLQQGYPPNMAIGELSQTAPDIMEDDEFQPQGPSVEATYSAYQTALKEIFQNIIDSRLADASKSLLEVSEWLLGHVGDLGLTVDEKSLHADRIRLWNEFNTAWLGIFQKQKDILESGLRIQQPQSLMSQDFIAKMAKDLIRMCDAIEEHGLVDYQYGVAEEQIILALTECLDLQESIEGTSGEGLQDAGVGRAPP